MKKVITSLLLVGTIFSTAWTNNTEENLRRDIQYLKKELTFTQDKTTALNKVVAVLDREMIDLTATLVELTDKKLKPSLPNEENTIKELLRKKYELENKIKKEEVLVEKLSNTIIKQNETIKNVKEAIREKQN